MDAVQPRHVNIQIPMYPPFRAGKHFFFLNEPFQLSVRVNVRRTTGGYALLNLKDHGKLCQKSR